MGLQMPTGKNKKTPAPRTNTGSGTVVRVTGTSPLSFEVLPGTTLTVREFAPSSYNRPTIGSGFKSSAYLLFHDETKVGRLSPDSLLLLGKKVPRKCTVSEVNRERKILRVIFK